MHHLDFTLIAVRGHAHITAHHILKAHKDFEFLYGFLVVEILMVVGPYPAYSQIKSAPVDVSMNSGNFEAEHHTLIVDGLVCLQKLIHGLVDCFGDSALDDMAYPDLRIIDTLTLEELLCRLMDGLYKGRV